MNYEVVVSRLVAAIALFSTVGSFVGCGTDGEPARIQIGGSVELDGKPLPDATLGFIAGGGAILSTAQTDQAGNFTAKVGAGINRVSVSKYEAVAASTSPPADEQALMGMETEARTLKAPKSAVPAKYADPSSSGLSFDMQQGMEPLTIQILSE